MNVSKVLEQVQALKNGYDVSDETITVHMQTLENRILDEIVRGREGERIIREMYGNIDLISNPEHMLFAPPGFEDIYALYCCAQIDLMFEDTERYINDSAVFKDTYNELKKYWWQTHRQAADYKYHA
jgi:hypothetical protein